MAELFFISVFAIIAALILFRVPADSSKAEKAKAEAEERAEKRRRLRREREYGEKTPYEQPEINPKVDLLVRLLISSGIMFLIYAFFMGWFKE